jgi:hypothetical protein
VEEEQITPGETRMIFPVFVYPNGISTSTHTTTDDAPAMLRTGKNLGYSASGITMRKNPFFS